jgi:hypothetical protein
MNEGASTAGPYNRLGKGEKRLHDRPLLEAVSALKTLVPLSRLRFDRMLSDALEQAKRRGSGFYLGGFAARRALGAKLLIDVDPSVLEKQLDHRVRQGDEVYSIRDRFLGAGDWTPLLHLLRRSSTHREVMEVVEADFDHRATNGYRRALERAGTERPVKRNYVALSSPAKVEAYFRQTTEMCRSIQRHGLLRRADYGFKLASIRRPSIRLPWVELGELDIGVAIGASGELYRFASGKHRTPAAQALGLNSIPVEVRMVHAEWLEQAIEETGLPPTEALLGGLDRLGVRNQASVA